MATTARIVRITEEAYRLAEKNGRGNRRGCIVKCAINICYPELLNVEVTTTSIAFTDRKTRERHYYEVQPQVVELIWAFDKGTTWDEIASAYANLVDDGIRLEVRLAHKVSPPRPTTAAQKADRQEKTALREARYAKETAKQKRDRAERNAQRESRIRGTGVA